jgi:hypothetical protein
MQWYLCDRKLRWHSHIDHDPYLVLQNLQFSKDFKRKKLRIKQTKLRDRCPRATAACRRSQCQPLRAECVAWSAQRILTSVNLGFLDRSRYFFIQVAPQLSSRSWVDPVPDPLLLRKYGRAGYRTRDLCICSQKLWPLDHRGGPNTHKIKTIYPA